MLLILPIKQNKREECKSDTRMDTKEISKKEKEEKREVWSRMKDEGEREHCEKKRKGGGKRRRKKRE